MKILALWLLSLLPLFAQDWRPAYDALLQKYATPLGVRYPAWKANATDLAQLRAITQALSGPQPAPDLALLLNAYNAWVLQGVLEKYPIKSVEEIAPDFGFFAQERIQFNGQKMSLNHLEKQLILKTYQDPRVHFALNCASLSCPPLQARAFRRETLSADLDALTAAFLNSNPEAMQRSSATGAITLSKIFEWYAADFASAGGPVAFANRYLQVQLPTNTPPAFHNYNWSLNLNPK